VRRIIDYDLSISYGLIALAARYPMSVQL